MSFKAPFFAEARVEVPETPNWLINRLVVRGALCVLAGDPKAGKSELVYQMVTCVATGQPFVGFETTQAGVLLVVAEEAKDAAIQRLEHFKLPVDARVALWTDTVVDTPDDRRHMGQFLQANPDIRLIVIDTLSSYFLMNDETDNSQVTARLKPYVDLAHHAGITIFFVHHQRKSREAGEDGDVRTVRGGSAIAALADAIFQFRPIHGGPITRRMLSIASRSRLVPTRLALDYPNYPEGGYDRL